MKYDKYSVFKEEISKTEARHILDQLLRNYATVKRQNSRVLNRVADIVQNQRHYLKVRFPEAKAREYFIKNLKATKEKMDKVLGNMYVSDRRSPEPKYFVKLTRAGIYRLEKLLKENRND